MEQESSGGTIEEELCHQLQFEHCQSQPFCIEAYACDVGLGAVLTQNGRLIAYLSKALGVKNAAKSTYEKELMDILMAISRWRHYGSTICDKNRSTEFQVPSKN